MTWVKLCGLRTADDVEVAVAAGANAIGFVVAPESPRRIDTETAAALGDGVPIERYLVTMDLDPDELLRQAVQARVTGVQPHGRSAAAAARRAIAEGLSVLYPVGSRPGGVVPEGAMPMIDGPEPGSGTAAAWEGLSGAEGPFVLAGGLTPQNVSDAIRATGAYGVDVSSGIESQRGVKDHALMRAFVEAVR